MKPIKFPGFQDVAGVDQGYMPLPFRKDMLEVQDRRAPGGKRKQPTLTFAFMPDEIELARLNAGFAVYLHIWHDVIPPMSMFVAFTEETQPTVISAVEDEEGYGEFCVITSQGWIPHVYLDGVEQKYCSSFDTVKGRVTVMARDEDDKPIIVGESYQSKDLYGKVTIRWERR